MCGIAKVRYFPHCNVSSPSEKTFINIRSFSEYQVEIIISYIYKAFLFKVTKEMVIFTTGEIITRNSDFIICCGKNDPILFDYRFIEVKEQ